MVQLTDDDLPVLGIVGNLICATDLGEAAATHDEHNQPGHILHRLLTFVLVPVPVACAAAALFENKHIFQRLSSSNSGVIVH